MTKLVVAAIVVLATVAAADAVRDDRAQTPARATAADAASTPRHLAFARGRSGDYRGHGHYLHDRVLRRGREYLSPEEIAAAFPVPIEGPVDISQVAVAPDGTLVLGVYLFPARSDARGALEFWRGRTLESAFPVPPGTFAGGLAFNRDGSLVATFSYDGALRGVYDRSGREMSSLSESFLLVD